MSEDISIVMAVYNHEATLRDAIDSALMQEMPYTSHIYCINDASTDSSANILAEYVQKYPDKISVYTSSTNQGSGKKAFLHNKPPVYGRYWCLLAGDDYWTTPNKLSKQIEFLNANSRYIGCSCNTVMRDEFSGTEKVIRPDRDSWNLLDLVMLPHKYAFYVHPSGIVWRNINLKKGFFLPPEYQKDYAFGDVVLMHMMLSGGGLVKNIPEVMSCYRVTGRGIWSSRSTEEQAEINIKLKNMLDKALPLKYKIYLKLQFLKKYSGMLDKLIIGPVNE